MTMINKTKALQVVDYIKKYPDASIQNVASEIGTSTSYVLRVQKAVNKASGSTVSDGSSADYYDVPKSCKQLQDLISHKDMNAQMGEIFRSCYRYGQVAHSKKLRDAKKIKFYAEAEIKRLEALDNVY
tara:strand:+ start:244 stop:627 length:384 start_codon:yes stop_codon:yes gene_type:complete